MRLRLHILALVLSAGFAGQALFADTNPFPVPEFSSVTQKTEERLHSYLENYLDSAQYLVTVTQKPKPMPSGAAATFLPGLPGWTENTPAGTRSYFDLMERFHWSAADRNPLQVDVILDSKVPADKTAIVKRMVPLIAGLNFTKGDELRVSTGALVKPTPPEPKIPPSALESLLSNRWALTVLGMIALLGVLAMVTALYFLRMALSPVPEKKTASAQPERKNSRYTPTPQTGSSNPALDAVMQDLKQQAKNHPERIARLVVDWIARGMSAEAAGLMQMFDIPMAESIFRHMPSSESEKLRPFFQTNFDPNSQDNLNMLTTARLDLIAQIAKSNRNWGKQDYSFLLELDPDIFMDVIQGESWQNVALVASQVPTSVLSDYIKNLSGAQLEAFFEALSKVAKLEPEIQKQTMAELRKKTDRVRSSPLTAASTTDAVADLLAHVSVVSNKRQVLAHLQKVAAPLARDIRNKVYFFEDIFSLSDSDLATLSMELDPTVLALSLVSTEADKRARVAALLPRTSANIVEFEAAQASNYSARDIANAQQQVTLVLQTLIKTKVLTPENKSDAAPVVEITKAAA